MTEVCFTEVPGVGGAIGLITLNRPQALNALNNAMLKALSAQLTLWATAKTIKAVIIRSSSVKAFCAGGDIRAIYELGCTDKSTAKHFFADEYRLNYQIATYPKPYIAILNGITMGGGAGLSLHGGLRLATADLIFAMPETSIGFFPDVGASYFLSRCPNLIGLYLGLTGTRINAADAVSAQLIDHQIAKNAIPAIIQTIANQPIEDITDIRNALNPYFIGTTTSWLLSIQEEIRTHFSKSSLAEILKSLNTDHSRFAQQTLTMLSLRSPTSLKVSYETFSRGGELDLKSCLQMEFNVMQQFLNTADLYEGIRATIIEKDFQPHWYPPHVSLVSDQDLSSFFTSTHKETLQLN